MYVCMYVHTHTCMHSYIHACTQTNSNLILQRMKTKDKQDADFINK